jgi:hypothetical protein
MYFGDNRISNVYVNHLDSRNDRLESIKFQFKMLDTEFNIFPAIKHQDGSVGNKLSFIKILETAILNNESKIFFFEDDALIRKCFSDDIGNIVNEIFKTDCDICVFHHPQPLDIEFNGLIGQRRKKPWCTQCLFVNNIIKVHDFMKTKQDNTHGLDFCLVNSNLNFFVTRNEYVVQLDDYSDIAGKEVRRFKHKDKYEDLLRLDKK